MDRLLALSDAELDSLAARLESGQLVRPFVKEDARVQAALLEAAAYVSEAKGVAWLLRGLLQQRRSRPRVTDVVEVVCTGPEAGATAVRDTAPVVRELFSAARERVLVVGYAVYQGSEVFERLAARMAEISTLQVTMCLNVDRKHGDTTASSNLIWSYRQAFIDKHWPPGARLPELFHYPAALEESGKRSVLHAKCVIADGAQALVSSANFTQAAQQRNVEVGLLVRSPEIAERLESHFLGLISAGVLVRMPGAADSSA